MPCNQRAIDTAMIQYNILRWAKLLFFLHGKPQVEGYNHVLGASLDLAPNNLI